MKRVPPNTPWLLGFALIFMSVGLKSFPDVVFCRLLGHLCDLGVGVVIGYYWGRED